MDLLDRIEGPMYFFLNPDWFQMVRVSSQLCDRLPEEYTLED